VRILDLGVSRYITPYSITTEMASICKREITLRARVKAQLHLIDWIGCAFHGLRYPQGRSLSPHTREQPAGKSSALGQGAKHVDAACFHNGCLGNIAEMDDVHRSSIVHPGPVVIPAALALAEHIGASGAQFLDAIIRGYEAVIRLGSSLGRRHYLYFHNTSTAGAFGAAAACASLLDLSDDQWVWAFGNAGTRTGGLWQMRNEACMSKALHNGMAAQSGLLAAQLAKRNFSGPRFILEGPQGLFPATASDGSPANICFDPQGEWRIMEVSFKPWAACRHAHPAIDAALKIRAALKPGSEVVAAEVETYQDALRFCDRAEPTSESEAKFSLQHAVSVALARGKPTLDDFVPPFTQSKVNALRASIKVVASDAFSKAYPEHYGARVTAELSDGSRVSEQVNDAWGDPAWPLLPAEVEQKAFQLMGKVGLNKEQIDQIFAQIRLLPEARSMAGLSKSLQSVNAG